MMHQKSKVLHLFYLVLITKSAYYQGFFQVSASIQLCSIKTYRKRILTIK